MRCAPSESLALSMLTRSRIIMDRRTAWFRDPTWREARPGDISCSSDSTKRPSFIDTASLKVLNPVSRLRNIAQIVDNSMGVMLEWGRRGRWEVLSRKTRRTLLK